MNNQGISFNVADEHRKDIILWKAELNTLEEDLKAKEKIEARIYELYRNNDLMRGLVEKMVDSVVGAQVFLQCNPDWETLGVSAQEAKDWCKIVERKFHLYVDSPENWVSADRSMDFTQMCRAAERSHIFTGEICATREWRRSPLGYSSCVSLFSSNRLKSPADKKGKVFYGIELDKYGAALAYHIEISKKPLSEKVNGANVDEKYSATGRSKEIKRYTRYNRFGWLQVYHGYEPLKPEYPRGISRLSSVLLKMKQIERYNEADLDKAIIATSYVYAITSDEDPETVADMLSGVTSLGDDSAFSIGGDDTTYAPEIMKKRQEILDNICNRYINITGGQMLHLFKGESVNVLSAPNTIQSSAGFVKGHTRSICNGAGISYELGTGDFEGLSFSGGQMSLGIYEHSANIQRKLVVHKFAKFVFRTWLDEAVDKGEVPLLGEKAYWPFKEAYARCSFSGAKRVYLDEVKRSKANANDLANGTTSRTEIVNQAGGDFEELTKQRGVEAEMILKVIEETVKKSGIELSDEAKTKIIIDVVATKIVETPDEPLEPDEPLTERSE